MEEKGVKKLAEKLQKTEKALESVQSKYQNGQEKIKELDKKLQSTSDKLSRSKNKNELLKQELEKEKKLPYRESNLQPFWLVAKVPQSSYGYSVSQRKKKLSTC